MTARQSRRAFLAGGATAATAVAATAVPAAADGGTKIAELGDIKPGEPVDFAYPGDAMAYLIDMGQAVEGGVGPNGSLVAFSALCQHRGCPVEYDEGQGLLVCPCHRSVFNPRDGGRVVEGPSQRGLPRITIEVRDGAVFATGVENGPVYGRACDNA